MGFLNEGPLLFPLPLEVFYYFISEKEQSKEMGCESHLYSLTLKDEKYLFIIPGIIQAHCIGKCDISLSLKSQGQEIRTYSAEKTSVFFSGNFQGTWMGLVLLLGHCKYSLPNELLK